MCQLKLKILNQHQSVLRRYFCIVCKNVREEIKQKKSRLVLDGGGRRGEGGVEGGREEKEGDNWMGGGRERKGLELDYI